MTLKMLRRDAGSMIKRLVRTPHHYRNPQESWRFALLERGSNVSFIGGAFVRAEYARATMLRYLLRSRYLGECQRR